MSSAPSILAKPMWTCLRQDCIANTGNGNVGYGLLLKALFFCPGFQLLLFHRIQVSLRAFGFVGRAAAIIVGQIAYVIFGCQISPLAKLGPGLKFPHPVSIVIGAGVVVGAGAVVYQSVTIGSKKEGDYRYPQVGDGVVLYPGAVIVGELVIAPHAVVGPNSVVISNVAEGDVVGGIPAVSLLKRLENNAIEAS